MPNHSATKPLAESITPPFRITEALLASLERATQVVPFDERLFDPEFGGKLALKLSLLLGSIQNADIEILVHAASWHHRLLGADVEARVRFRLARQKVVNALSETKLAARQASNLLQYLEATLLRVRADSERLTMVAEKADAIGSGVGLPATLEEQELLNRYRRRLSNLSAIRSSNALTLAQIPVAISFHRRLLDRFTDIESVLIPVWERHALQLLHGKRDQEAISQARQAARGLLDRLLEALEEPRR